MVQYIRRDIGLDGQYIVNIARACSQLDWLCARYVCGIGVLQVRAIGKMLTDSYRICYVLIILCQEVADFFLQLIKNSLSIHLITIFRLYGKFEIEILPNKIMACLVDWLVVRKTERVWGYFQTTCLPSTNPWYRLVQCCWNIYEINNCVGNAPP